MIYRNFNDLFRSRGFTPGARIIGLAMLAAVFLCSGLARAASPGALDLSFGTRGTASGRIGSSFQNSNAIAIQPDGKVVLAGYTIICVGSACSSDFLLVRFNTNGTLDTSFDTDGYVVTDHFGQDEAVFAIAIQADGKIVVAGGAYNVSNGADILGFKVFRYLPNGTLDTDFGTGGRVYESFDDDGGTPQSMLIQPDGKIVVVGGLDPGMLFAARFNTNGSLDTNFGTQGRIKTNYAVTAVRVARQSDGKIIVVGNSQPQGTVKLIRFNSDGTPDATFGSMGVVTTTFTSSITPEVAVQADDKIILSGEYQNNDIRIPPLRRFNADGTLDNSFTPDHGQIIDGACTNCTQRVVKILPLPDGRFYLAGYFSSLNTLPTALTVSRYLSNGTIDSSYGFRGTSVNRYTNTPQGPNPVLLFYSVTDAALQPDGKVVVTGNGDLQVGNFGQTHLLAIRLTATVTAPSMRGDFDGDRKTDFAVFRPSTRFWYVLRSSDSSFYGERYGLDGDVLTPGDYNYDLKTDLSVYRSSDNGWYISPSLPSGGGTAGGFFGQPSDIRVSEDYDGDGYTDLAVFRPSTGAWTVRYRALLLMNRALDPMAVDVTFQFGLGTDKPVPADYDGDGRADFAVFRPSTGDWYILKSSDGLVTSVNFGLGTDKLVPGDYDGDLKTDVAVYRDGSWYILRSSDNAFVGIGWGLATDKPAPGDYDGDGKFDVAVYRPSEGAWYVLRSSDGGVMTQQWGISEDTPIPFTFVK